VRVIGSLAVISAVSAVQENPVPVVGPAVTDVELVS
jgi:hypothetical protein